MQKAASYLITINGGSSSVKFAIFSTAESPQRLLSGTVERIGLGDTTLVAKHLDSQRVDRIPLTTADGNRAAEQLADWLAAQIGPGVVVAVGHRIVHGGTRLIDHQPISDAVLAELRKSQQLDLAHLPREISLIETFGRKFVQAIQIACFDTAFFRNLPHVAQTLPIPRKFLDAGVRRFGFHGLSYSYLISQLSAIAPAEAQGRVILAHLGAGASMAALQEGRPIDTSMAFTPTAGLVMGTRSGDLDPGLLIYLMRAERMTLDQIDDFVNRHCGLLALAETSYDMRDLLARRKTDPRADEAIALFCYQAKKFIGAYAAALGGLDALVFAGGIGEHAAEIRTEICGGLDFLGLRVDQQRNLVGAAEISVAGSSPSVRIIPTDEELEIAMITRRLAGIGKKV